MLGYACNILCKFCSQDLDWRKDGWLPLKAAREQVYLAYRRGARILNLLGGEVTVYPDVLPLVSFARKLGFETVQFETNGIRLADRAFAQALFDAGLTRVSISVHAAAAEPHDRLVKAPGAFDKLLKGMDHLNELGIAIRTAFVLNRANFRDAAAFCRFFWTEKRVPEFQFIYPLYTGDFLNHFDEMAVPISAVVPELEKAFALLEKLGCLKPPNIHNIPPCFFPSRLSQMGDWQDVGMEVLKPDGKSYRDTAETPLYRKAFAASCAQCGLRERCVGIDPAYLRRWGEGEIKPVLGASVPAPRP
jgi:MoaA/NifB/PqqE/SkfB family radical SAM enzyme